MIADGDVAGDQLCLPAIRDVDLGKYLTELLQNLKGSLQALGHSASLRTDLASLILATKNTINLGIVVTELVTNAFKYAYPEGPGEIRVRLRAVDEISAELVVEDDGVGRLATAKGSGLGTRIVMAMASSMNAEVDYHNLHPGTAVCLKFSLFQ